MSEYLDVPSSSGISGLRVKEEPADTHELMPDRTTGEMLLAVGCRDDRPVVDSESVVSTCPVDYAMSGPTGKVDFFMNLEMCWENHYSIMVSSAMFPASTEKVAP